MNYQKLNGESARNIVLEWGCVIMRESNLPLIPANDSSEIKLQKL